MLYCLFVISHRKAHYSQFHDMDVKRKLLHTDERIKNHKHSSEGIIGGNVAIT